MSEFMNKIRVVWKESVDRSIHTLSPSLSFDGGLYWISLSENVNVMRQQEVVSTDTMERKSLGDNYYQMDVCISPTPVVIPFIERVEIKNSAFGFASGKKWYFAVASESYDVPNISKEDGSIRNTYFHSPLSKIECVDLTNKTGNFEIDLFVKYPDFINGILVYVGESPESMVLYQHTNMATEIFDNGSTQSPYFIAESDNVIYLRNADYFPKTNGIVKIDSEYIQYSLLESVENVLTTGIPGYKMTVAQRGYWGTKPEKHYSMNKNPVLLSNHRFGGQYGEIAPKIWPKLQMVPNLIQYLPFDNSDYSNYLIKDPDTTSEVLMQDVLEVPTNQNGLSFSKEISITQFGQSLKMNSISCLNPNIAWTKINSAGDTEVVNGLPASGTIHFYVALDSLPKPSENGIFEEDKFLFGEDSKLWMRVSNKTMKPYLGFGVKENGLFTDKNLSLENDSSVPSLKIGQFTEIAVAWDTEIDSSNKAIKQIYFYVNNELIDTYSIPNDPNLGAPFLGACRQTKNVNIPLHIFKGYIDEWRVFNRCLDQDDLIELSQFVKTSNRDYCGKYSLFDDSQYKFLAKPYFEISASPIATISLTKDQYPNIFNDFNVAKPNDCVCIYFGNVKQTSGYTVSKNTNQITITFSPTVPVNTRVGVFSNSINKYEPKYKLLVNGLLNDTHNSISPSYSKLVVENVQGELLPSGMDLGKLENVFIDAMSKKDLYIYQRTGTSPNYVYTLYSNWNVEPLNGVQDKYKFTFGNASSKTLVFYFSPQTDVSLQLNNWALELGYEYDNQQIPYPIKSSNLKLKMDMSSLSIFSTPKVKELFLIVSKTSMPDML
jgi:hypothetical protein